jgi:predicted nucleic acid-binding protein
MPLWSMIAICTGKGNETDCVSNVVMKQREITEVFTFDHHFEQMGFVKQP